MTKPGAKVVRLMVWLLAAALVAGGLIVWVSPLLGVRTVAVQGVADPDLRADVQAAIDVPSATPLARIDLAAVEHRVADIPAVASASVSRQWPHTLLVTVTRRAVVAVTQANGRWWMLDGAGTPFSPQQARPAGPIPLKLASPGPADPATLAALRVVQSLSQSIERHVVSIQAASAHQVTLELADGRTVLWGEATNAELKNQVLAVMLGQPGTHIDISDPTLVTVRGAPTDVAAPAASS